MIEFYHGKIRGGRLRTNTTVDADDWMDEFIRSPSGGILPTLANAMLALRRDPAINDAFIYDKMLRAPMLTRRLPGGNDVLERPRIVTDNDVGILQEYLQKMGLVRLSKDTAHQAADMRARERPTHPLEEYLSALVWDGRERLTGWLPHYLGADDSLYAREVGKMSLISMVARVFEPGCKADYMLVLEGPQGSRKSTACSIIGGSYFSDSLPDVGHSKEAAQHLAGKWVIEVSEMSAMSRAESAALKAFITRPMEQYRPSYGRKEVIEPRQCIFIGTTNQKVYLRDETGGRRFWPVEVGFVDIEMLARDRDQLFAEAVHRYLAGDPWWPTAEFERVSIRPQQEQRFEADAWEETIASWLEGRGKAYISEVAREALQLETSQVGTAIQRRIAVVLERLHWRRLHKDSTGKIPWQQGD